MQFNVICRGTEMAPEASFHRPGTIMWRYQAGPASWQEYEIGHDKVPVAELDSNGNPILVYRLVPSDKLPNGWTEQDEGFERIVSVEFTYYKRVVRYPHRVAYLSVDDNELVRWAGIYDATVVFKSRMMGSEFISGTIYI